MTGKEYQKWALTKDREDYRQLAVRLVDDKTKYQQLHAALGLSGEVGELVDALKKSIFYNRPLDVENVKEEVGDMLWYAAILLESIGSSFEEVMKMNHDKLEKRYPTGFSEKLATERLDKK